MKSIGKLPFLATVTGAIYNSDQTINWVKETRVKSKKKKKKKIPRAHIHQKY
jgi:hypothetical protein